MLGWLGYGIVFSGLLWIVVGLFKQEFRWETLIFPMLGSGCLYTSYRDGQDKRFVVSVEGNELDDKIYQWIINNGLSSMEELKKLDPPSESILDCDDLKKIKKEMKK